MKVWITQYALTTGIIEAEATVESIPSIARITNGLGGVAPYVHKPHWYDNFEDAQDRAEAMRCRKLLSLRKQRDKIEKLRFTADTVRKLEDIK